MRSAHGRMVLAGAALLIGVTVLGACGDDEPSATDDGATTTADTDAPDGTTTTEAITDPTPAAVEPFAWVGNEADYSLNSFYTIESCVRSGEAGVVMQATSDGYPATTLSIDAASGSGTVTLGPGTYSELEFEVADGDGSEGMADFDLDPAPAGAVFTSIGPDIIVVYC